jgi:D-serine deaminase-like pyridoxal phosphate-dependent protein
MFEGIAFFPGHVRKLDEKGVEALRQVGSAVQQVLDDFRLAGIEVRIVSGGSTPTLFHSHELTGLNEIRPGTYIYNDMNTVRSGACSLDDCAASISVTVVSTARSGRMIIDGGSKTFSSDLPMNAPERTFGRVVEAPECVFHNMNEEHGFIDIRNAGRSFTVGDRIRIIPNHVCPAVNLHERVYGIRRGEVEQVWEVEGRGKLQ